MLTISASNCVLGVGMSTDIRSKPQFSHSSTPWMLTKPHCGQITASALDCPGLAANEQLVQVALTLSGDRIIDLAHYQLVVRRPLGAAQHSDWNRVVRPPHA